jgi:hypothetical protein
MTVTTLITNAASSTALATKLGGGGASAGRHPRRSTIAKSNVGGCRVRSVVRTAARAYPIPPVALVVAPRRRTSVAVRAGGDNSGDGAAPTPTEAAATPDDDVSPADAARKAKAAATRKAKAAAALNIKGGKGGGARKADSTDAVASFLTRRFGIAGGLAWLGILTFGAGELYKLMSGTTKTSCYAAQR